MTGEHDASLDARAAGLLRTGERAQRENLYELAIDCYEEALDTVPNHQAALFNLAVSSIRLRRYREALDTLKRLEQLLPADQGSWHDLLYAVLYNRALANWELSKTEGLVMALDEALSAARLLTLQILARTRKPRFRRSEPMIAARKELPERVEGPATSQLAGLIVDFLARAGEAATATPERRRWDDAELLAAVTASDWSLPTAEALAADAREHHEDDVFTRYNLAVYHILRPKAADADGAIRDLGYAVEHDTGLATWALHDPLLDPLRTADPEWFKRLAKRQERRDRRHAHPQ